MDTIVGTIGRSSQNRLKWTTGRFTGRLTPPADPQLVDCSTDWMIRFWLAVALCLVTVPAVRGAPQVAFDFASAVACREFVVDPSPRSTEPAGDSLAAATDEVLVEANFQVSVRLMDGQEEDLEEIHIELINPRQRMRLVEFSPQTTLASEYVGEIALQTTDESSQTATASLKAGFPPAVPPPFRAASAGVDLSAVHKTAHTETVKKRPPLRPLVVSGTAGGGHGVFLKFRQSQYGSLEGVHRFHCVFRVSKHWRGDWMILTCSATGPARRSLFRRQTTCGQAQRLVALYRSGDGLAREAALALAASQHQWLLLRQPQPNTWPFLLRKILLRDPPTHPDWNSLLAEAAQTGFHSESEQAQGEKPTGSGVLERLKQAHSRMDRLAGLPRAERPTAQLPEQSHSAPASKASNSSQPAQSTSPAHQSNRLAETANP